MKFIISNFKGEIRPSQKMVHRPKSRRKSGFALVSTILIISLLLLIALAMLSLSSVEQRTTKSSQDAAQAQANARIALMMALANLQRQMGPDSRISAPHDAGSIATGGQPHWTAVYDAWDMAEAGVKEDPTTRNPKFRGWLVSGIDPVTGQPVGEGSSQIKLMGSGTLGPLATPADEVHAPSVAISEGGAAGHIAWWVSDEGAKAKVNAGPTDETIASFGKADPLFRAQSPPNTAHRTITQLEDFAWTSRKRDATVSTKELDLAATLGANGLGTAVHDITVYSAGVLADVRAGRLKRDLSALLSRPIEELENKPLYVADGRMNRFQIGEDGSFANGKGIPASWTDEHNTGGHWGINLEELHMYHSLPGSLDWSGGSPRLLMPSTREAAAADRHYLYKRPAIEVTQYIFSLIAVPDGGPTGSPPKQRYKMEMRMDAMVVLWNPNDVPLVYSPGLALPIQLQWLPYDLEWNIQRGTETPITSTFKSPYLETFRGFVGGENPTGFTIEPGEAAVFGSGAARGYELDLARGFVPSGQVILEDWDLHKENLDLDHQVDFKFSRSSRTKFSSEFWVYSNAWLGQRHPNPSWRLDQFGFVEAPEVGGASDPFFPPEIFPSQVLKVSDFVGKAKPVIMLSFMKNVEQPSGLAPVDAFASRPYQLSESSVHRKFLRSSQIEKDRHATQIVGTAESMNFTYKSLAAGAGGRNIYIGGGRQPGFGGSFNRISRRIPLTPPLSMAAFQYGIATGFCDHWVDEQKRKSVGGADLVNGGSPPDSSVALSGNITALPVVKSVIGNSTKLPNIPKENIFHTGSDLGLAANVVEAQIASDHSWMANTALWDAWFLSSIVDGTGEASTPYQTDNRTAREQFSDFAKGIKPLRNTRYKFHANRSPDEALAELFDGDDPSDPAINLLAKYLLIDGAFNVNSTSEAAWEAMLASVRDQEIMNSDGDTEKFDHPFGTLGYATETDTDGNIGDWMGLRNLSADEIKSLAEAIVVEVKDRGPFLSMSDFVNRRPNGSKSEHKVVGALQAAIDKAGLNSEVTGGNRELSADDFAGLDGRAGIDDEPAPARSVGAPGHLSQGDLLAAIGSQITVRSDTFVIRAYGDVRDTNNPDRIIARAWCEAVVQRYPEYMDPKDAPEAQDGWPSATDSLTETNQLFGRRFKIMSFKWLGQNEI